MIGDEKGPQATSSFFLLFLIRYEARIRSRFFRRFKPSIEVVGVEKGSNSRRGCLWWCFSAKGGREGDMERLSIFCVLDLPFRRMETTEDSRLNSEITEKVVQIFSHFMERVAKYEEQVVTGNRFLDNFRQSLDFIRRPSIDNTSQLFENVIKANNTDRLQSYIKAGYTHASDRAENLNKLHKNHIQLLDIANKGNSIIKELESLVEDLNLVIESANETLPQDLTPDLDDIFNEEQIVTFVPEKSKVIDYATMVALVYSMVKKDYLMQEKIVSTLNLKTSSEELETYCLMWSLRPFVNDEIMQKAWRLIP
ncbi:unnamed protein product [Lactuca saligna]|uniref:DUF7795 domain-containing protein n=1 Tax=Lactuca saligna TaxID=75948 RepID=A0AA35ZPV7_LACSI|nr:unnamed protein product [Lactuca saligna]